MKSKIVLTVLCVMGFGVLIGCTHNLTKLDENSIYSRTSTASTARMDGDGNLAASYQGIGPLQLMQDADGQWLNMEGAAAIMSARLPGSELPVYLVSPKDVKIAKLNATIDPATGAWSVSVEGLEANISAPLALYVQALQARMGALEGMTKEEAMATVEKWKIAGEIAPDVAAMLVNIITTLAGM